MGIDARILLRIKSPVTPELIALWTWDLNAAVGAEKFMQPALSLSSDYDDKGREGKVYFQDGPELFADSDETFLDANLWTRYYGVGYERGDLNTIINTAQWCEQNIPNCTVYYGGDSSGVEAEPFDKSKRDALLEHMLGPHGRDYFNYNSSFRDSDYGLPPRCTACVPDRGPRRYMWGGGSAGYYCPGCNKHFETRDSGASWQTKEKQ